MFYSDVMNGIDIAARSNPRSFKAAVFNLFRTATFGTDLADVIDVDKTKIKEMTVDRINELEKTTGNLRVEKAPSGYSLGGQAITGRRFFMTGPNAPKGHLLQFRFKFRPGDEQKIYKELKLQILLGGGAYLPKADKNKKKR